MRLKTSSADDSVNYRYSGILVHPTSFPSPYGIGDFGKGAYDFIDFLEASGQHLWQILPLNPITSYGNSPYQGFSVFAGEPLLLSPQLLKEQGLLAEEDLRVIPDFDPVRVDYEAVRAYKYPLYRKAYQNFLEGGGTALQEVYDDFCARNEDWLSDYCLYMAIKDEQEGLPWTKWPEALRNLSEKDRAFWTQKLEKEIGYYAFLQFCFRFQWASLKEYANDRGIAIIGDIPIRPTKRTATAGGSPGCAICWSRRITCGSITSGALSPTGRSRRTPRTPSPASGGRARARSCSAPSTRLSERICLSSRRIWD